MLNDEDILKLKSVLATKEDIVSFKEEMNTNLLGLKGDISYLKNDVGEVKSEVADLKELIQGLIVSSDSIAKSIGNLSVEYAAITSQLSRHELWIKQIAEKVGLNLITE
ncbi:MAG: hypothetical protein WCI91_02805 [Candidatus Nomurabacteria bacterium]